MSCSQPFLKFNKLTNRYDSIPCGWCIKCRIDKRMYYKTRFEYSFYKEHKGTGTFLCITYDDNHLPLSPINNMPTLRKSDSQKFIKRIRSYLDYYKIDGEFVHRNFKYIAVGEYGEDLGRCHIHYLISGIDYQAGKSIFRDCWKNGVIIDSKPILQGGINYVLKYIDKQQHGSQIQEEYLDQGREPPFFHSSHDFGFEVYNNYNPKTLTFKYGAKNIPLPSYVKNKLLAYNPRGLSSRVCDFASKNHMSYDEANKYLVEVQERAFERSMRQNGEPVSPARCDGEFCSALTVRPRNFSR